MAAQHTSPLQALLVDERFDGEVYVNEPMSRHTSYRLGGPARFFVCVGSVGALSRLIDACRDEEVPWIVLGKGSNVLVSDKGFSGVVISLGRDFRVMRVEEAQHDIIAGAGVLLSSAVQEAFKRSLAGLEFAVGTPGTIGGALRMNAGSRDEWIGSRVASVTTCRPDDGLTRYAPQEIHWGYRCSSFADDEVILECELSLQAADSVYIRTKMEENLSRRKDTQPLNQASCGSVFRNPEGASAAALIDKCGLKGTRIGGAQVSEVHANFIVNDGTATADEVARLISLVAAKVYKACGIELKPEVCFVGFE